MFIFPESGIGRAIVMKGKTCLMSTQSVKMKIIRYACQEFNKLHTGEFYFSPRKSTKNRY